MKWFILCLFCSLVPCGMALAQNTDRFEEEAMMDEVRRQKVMELIDERRREEERIRNTDYSEEELRERNLVEVEPNNILPSDLSSSSGALVPYSVRRPRWGVEAGVAYSLYHPSSYVSDFTSAQIANFDQVYGNDDMIELFLNYKFNFTLGSIGLAGSIGIYGNETEDSGSFGSSTLDLKLGHLHVKYIIDNLFFEPVIAPYAGVGTYVVQFEEEQNGNIFGGATDPAVFYYVGAMFQLDWLDKSAAVEAYSESGIENTFIFLEGRQYLASSAEADPDFSTDIDLSAGLSLEF